MATMDEIGQEKQKLLIGLPVDASGQKWLSSSMSWKSPNAC
jgi:hypothetical protein